MRQAITNAFDRDISNCLTETNSSLIEVFDCYDCIPAKQRSYIKTEESQVVHFVLNNPTSANLVFAALDNCIMQSHELSRCDFVLGNFEKLYFVEIKQGGKRRQARSEAIQQLHSSISLFRNKINLTNTELIAVINLKAREVHPLQNATRKAERVAFKENYNADLMEGQSHTF